MSRRDLRSGQQTANATFTSDGLKININWKAPYACVHFLSFLLWKENVSALDNEDSQAAVVLLSFYFSSC